ncbi:hypothetical protein TruAng_010578 [Truncatella angustata]|nr:hypothetical protein TruAng_010578 [Truncatella angustata]
MHHTQYVLRINPRILDLWIVWVYTAKHNPVSQFIDQLPHTVAEEARSRSEILWWKVFLRRVVSSPDLVAYRFNLGRQLLVAQRPAGLVVHRMVAKLVAAAYYVGQNLLSSGDLAADRKEGRRGVIRLQDPEDLFRVFGRGVVDGQRDHLRLRFDFP